MTPRLVNAKTGEDLLAGDVVTLRGRHSLEAWRIERFDMARVWIVKDGKPAARPVKRRPHTLGLRIEPAEWRR